MKHLSKALLLCLPLVLVGCDDDEAPVAPPTTGGGGTQTGARLVGVEDNKLLQFSPASPGTILGEITMTGFTGEGTSNPPFVVGADFRLASAELYVVMSDKRFYTVSTSTGAATLKGQLATTGDIRAFNFDPTRDRLRVIDTLSHSYDFELDGTLAGDTTLDYAPGDPHAADEPSIEAVAFTGNNGTATTTQYVIDGTLDLLATVGSVNGTPTSADSGQLFTVADLSQPVGGAGPPPFAIESISGGAAYLTDSNGTETHLFRVNLATGELTDLGEVGTDRRIQALTVVGGVPGGGGGGGGGGNPPPGGVGGDEFCTTPIVGANADIDVGEASAQCLGCSVINADNVVDNNLDNFARFDFGVGLLLAGIPVTVTAPTGTVYPRERLAGGVFHLPDTSPTEISVAPDLTITTFLLGEEQESFTLGGDSLMVALLGLGLSDDRFFAGFETTEPFDAIEIFPSVGVLGVTMQLELYTACAGAEAAGSFPP